MSNKKLAGVLGACMALIIAVVTIAALPPASGEPDDGEPNENSAFHINVIPETSVLINKEPNFKYSIPGQQLVFLVTISDKGKECELPVHISATAPSAEVVTYQEDIVEGEITEVVVIPAPASIGTRIEITITGTRGSASDEKVAGFEVAEGKDDRQEYAEMLPNRFVAWLTTNRPELRITADTAWNGTTVSPIWLVVSHYLCSRRNGRLI